MVQVRHDHKTEKNALGQTIDLYSAIHREKVWQGRMNLKVYFMNPDDIDDWWRCRGELMSINTILAWARVWNLVPYPEIPVFEMVEIAQRADIRVQFSNTGGNWSMVGMEATHVKDLKKPTMQLNLGGHSPELQESLVIHSFGHALGLEHEHQCSDFWEVVGKHIDVERMKKDPLVARAFEAQWAARAPATPGEQTVNSLSEYDPKSIMHYWFDIKWIKSELLQTYENIDRDPSLREIERNYLKALHERSKLGQLPKQPSTKDYERLRAVYGGVFDESAATSLSYDFFATKHRPFNSNMSTDELVSWMQSRGLPQRHCDIIKGEGINGESFPLMDRLDFKILGIDLTISQKILGKLLEEAGLTNN